MENENEKDKIEVKINLREEFFKISRLIAKIKEQQDKQNKKIDTILSKVSFLEKNMLL